MKTIPVVLPEEDWKLVVSALVSAAMRLSASARMEGADATGIRALADRYHAVVGAVVEATKEPSWSR